MAEPWDGAYTARVNRVARGHGRARTGGQVGTLLRHWRTTRRVSQLDLALDADVSSRHLSFVETGRAQPSREMVLRLAEALEVPLRERNALLLAAGYAPVYRETRSRRARARGGVRGRAVHPRPAGALPRDRRGPPLEPAARQRGHRPVPGPLPARTAGRAPERHAAPLPSRGAASLRRELGGRGART